MSCKDCVHCNECDLKCYGDICNHFKNKANFVEVVRCKECKYCEDMLMSGMYCNHPDNRNPVGCRPDDFCNDGERRADNG